MEAWRGAVAVVMLLLLSGPAFAQPDPSTLQPVEGLIQLNVPDSIDGDLARMKLKTHCALMSSRSLLASVLDSNSAVQKTAFYKKFVEDGSDIAALQKRIKINHVGDTLLISVSIKGDDVNPNDAAVLINALGDAYIMHLQNAQVERMSVRIDSLRNWLERYEQEAATLQDKIEAITTAPPDVQSKKVGELERLRWSAERVERRAKDTSAALQQLESERQAITPDLVWITRASEA